MEKQATRRWIANLIDESERDMPVMPWTRAAKQERRQALAEEQEKRACG